MKAWSIFEKSIQYRMHPEISALPSKLFYESRISNGPNLQVIRKAPWHDHDSFGPFYFFNVKSGREEKSRYEFSFSNPTEADIVCGLIDHMCHAFPKIDVSSRLMLQAFGF